MENKYHKSKEAIAQEYAEVRKAQENHQHFSVLYERYYDVIFTFIWKRLDDEEATADTTQHVFLKAMINIKQFHFKGLPFSSWLFRIAVNEVNQYFRKSSRTRVVSMEDEQARHLAAEVRDADKDETIQLILKALPNLERDDIQLIELRFFEELSFAEIGDIFGISENNAKVRTYRAIDKLKKKVTSR